VPDPVETARQHVLQESTQELEHRQCHLSVVVLSAATIRKRHLASLRGKDALSRNRRAEHIPAQVFQRGHSIAHRFDIRHELATELVRRWQNGRTQLCPEPSFELRAEQL